MTTDVQQLQTWRELIVSLVERNPLVVHLPHHVNHILHSVAVAQHVEAHIAATGVLQLALQIPDVPTFAEAGVPEFNMSVWNGIAAPAGTPPAVIARLEQALVAALKRPGV